MKLTYQLKLGKTTWDEIVFPDFPSAGMFMDLPFKNAHTYGDIVRSVSSITSIPLQVLEEQLHFIDMQTLALEWLVFLGLVPPGTHSPGEDEPKTPGG